VLTIPHCKESLSRAYVTAVVGRSRNSLLWGREFDYGVDGSVRVLRKYGTRILEIGQGFDFQSKTTTDWTMDGQYIVYDLEAKTFNDLAFRAGTGAFPFLLILLCLPKDENGWLDVSSDKFILQKCAFWAKLDGTITSNGATKRIRIPVANVFTPAAVETILNDIVTGAMLP
jgi:hypothetical protein